MQRIYTIYIIYNITENRVELKIRIKLRYIIFISYMFVYILIDIMYIYGIYAAVRKIYDSLLVCEKIILNIYNIILPLTLEIL